MNTKNEVLTPKKIKKNEEGIEEEKKEISIKEILNSNEKDNKKKAKTKLKNSLNKKMFEKHDIKDEILTKEIIDTFDIDIETHKILLLLTQSFNRRTQKENELIFSFLTKLKMNEVIKSDLLETDLSWKEIYQYIEPYIFGRTYKFYDTIFYSGEESDLLYILIDGKVGRYSLVELTESVSCEEYFLFLSRCHLNYKQMLEKGPNLNIGRDISEVIKPKKIEDKKDNTYKNENHREEKYINILELKPDEYIDEFLLDQIIEKNNEIYPLHSLDDLDNLKDLIFKVKLSSLLSEGKNTEIIELYEKFKFPITFLGFDKVIEREISPQLLLQKLNKSLGVKGHYYMKQLGLINQKIKIMKYVKKDNLTPFNFFGNFEIIDSAPKRKFTSRCETGKCLVICIDKKMYSSIIYEIQKNKREKEINSFHAGYIFKNININYFTSKIFSQFKIKNLFKGDVLFSQDKNLDHFILVKEGVIELSLQNISFFELNQLIKKIKEILIMGAKKYSMDFNEIFNFKMDIDAKTTIKFSIINEVINKKRNFTFSRSQKGFFGDYELFFGIPSLMTGIVASDTCKAYYYDFNKFKNLTEETYIINECLKQTSFFKLKAILKRLINLYNSYWKLCHDSLNKEENETEDLTEIKDNENDEPPKKKIEKLLQPNSPAKINPNLKNIFISHSINNSTDFNVSNAAGSEEVENVIKSYLNKNNNTRNSKFFRTSLELAKARYRFQNINKSKMNNNIQSVKENEFLKDSNHDIRKINRIEHKENLYKKSYDNIKNQVKNGTLFKEFKNILDAERTIARKRRKKVFLPPILKVPEELINYPIFKTDLYKNVNMGNNDNNNEINNDNENEKTINKSIEINKSNEKSIEKSPNKTVNKSINNSNNKSNEKSSVNNSKSIKIKNKIKLKKLMTLNLRIAQFNTMRYKKNILRQRNPKLYRLDEYNSEL